MKHTPTPWKVNKRAAFLVEAENRSIGSVGGYSDGTDDTHFENKANAAFIVKAVNSHDKLLNTLKEVEYFLTQIDPVHWPSRKGARQEIAAVREAIKQAEAE